MTLSVGFRITVSLLILLPKLRGSDSYPGGTDSHRTRQPSLDAQWLLEGNATYVEPVARAQAMQLDPAMVWRWSMEGMPKGQPLPGDLGLDNTPTWGRIYWGGALFWLFRHVF